MDSAEWPWPGDSTLDRAKRVAWSYRTALARLSPEVCAKLDTWAYQHGQGWVSPDDLAYDLEQILTVRQAAAYCNVQRRTIYAWHQRGLPYTPTKDGSIMVKVADLVRYEADRRRERHRTS